MNKATKLLHTRYRVNDLERTVKFYKEVLGLEELRRHSLLRFGDCFRQKIQDTLNSRLGNHQLPPETRPAIEFVGAIDNVGVVLSGVFSDDFHGEWFVAVVAVDAGAHRAQQRY